MISACHRHISNIPRIGAGPCEYASPGLPGLCLIDSKVGMFGELLDITLYIYTKQRGNSAIYTVQVVPPAVGVEP